MAHLYFILSNLYFVQITPETIGFHIVKNCLEMKMLTNLPEQKREPTWHEG